MIISDENINTLYGVGQSRANQLYKLGIVTVDDLLCHFPRDYEDRRNFCPICSVLPGQSICIKATVAHDIQTNLIRRGMIVSKTRIFDDSGAITVIFFNRQYVKEQLKSGQEYNFFGKADLYGSAPALINPEFEASEQSNNITGRILPVYPLTKGISRNILIKLIKSLMPRTDKIPDIIPAALIRKNRLCSASDAYKAIHFPLTLEDAQAARSRLAYEEIFLLCLRLRQMRASREKQNVIPMQNIDISEFTSQLDFELTDSQKNAVTQAFSDMTGVFAMNRLIQGDVGSGKTVVAAACIFLAAKNKFQSILMAPTEILAVQHYNNLKPLFDKFGISSTLLTGSLKKSEKDKIYERFASGEIDLLIGTHAVLNDNIKPLNLGLVITDEQHRFGVSQRLALSEKGIKPHTLLLSATPIPRTLGLILFRELDVSIIDELPNGRQTVDTFLIGNDKRKRMYGFIEKLISDGGQGYIVCPAIEDENENIKAVTSHAEYLQNQVFPHLKVAVLHGKMKSAEKNRIMQDFACGNIDLLVSTSVIEVGVDVSNASVIVIENAERFGLSALHQLRGRVGRGNKKSYCILIDGNQDACAPERLKILTKVSDGFKIAEEDLKQRGPGDFFGSRQHGLPELKVANFLNVKILQAADNDATELLNRDPSLSLPEHKSLLAALSEFSQICG